MKAVSVFAMLISIFSVQAFAFMVYAPPKVLKSASVVLDQALESRGETASSAHVTGYDSRTGNLTYLVAAVDKSGRTECSTYVIANIEYKGKIRSALLPEYPIAASCQAFAAH